MPATDAPGCARYRTKTRCYRCGILRLRWQTLCRRTLRDYVGAAAAMPPVCTLSGRKFIGRAMGAL